MGHADPGALTAASGTLKGVAQDAIGAGHTLDVQARTAVGACGPGPVGPAVERFGTAWGAEYFAWGCGAQSLGQTASENAGQFVASTGGR